MACMRNCLHSETHILFCQAEELLGLRLLHLPVAACHDKICNEGLLFCSESIWWQPLAGAGTAQSPALFPKGSVKARHVKSMPRYHSRSQSPAHASKQSDLIVHACIAVTGNGSACYAYVEAIRLLPYMTTAAAMPLPAITRLTLPQGILLMSDGGGNCVRVSASISTSQASSMPGRCPAPTTATILVALHTHAGRLSF